MSDEPKATVVKEKSYAIGFNGPVEHESGEFVLVHKGHRDFVLHELNDLRDYKISDQTWAKRVKHVEDRAAAVSRRLANVRKELRTALLRVSDAESRARPVQRGDGGLMRRVCRRLTEQEVELQTKAMHPIIAMDAGQLAKCPHGVSLRWYCEKCQLVQEKD